MPDSKSDLPDACLFQLAADAPPPFTVQNPESTLPLLLVCDHASRDIPACLGDLGLDPIARHCHLAWDIGAGALTRALATRLGVTAVFAGYSRLVMDCNRQLTDPSAYLEFGDGVEVPGNIGLSDVEKAARAQALYWPYHHAIDAEIKRLTVTGVPPAMIAIHSFTPVLDGVARPWNVGVLWDTDSRIATPMISQLRQSGFEVGDNQPYSGRAPQDFTIDHHAEAAGLPHVGLEIRQDLIVEAVGVERMAVVLAEIIPKIMAAVVPNGSRISAC